MLEHVWSYGKPFGPKRLRLIIVACGQRLKQHNCPRSQVKIHVIFHQNEQWQECAVGGSAGPPVRLSAACPLSGGPRRGECGSHLWSRSPGQEHDPGQRPHHGAFGGSDRPTRERHDTSGAPAALFQDARLRWQQPAGWAGARHSYHTCTQRGERRAQPADERGGPHLSHRRCPEGRRQKQRRLHRLRRVRQVAGVTCGLSADILRVHNVNNNNNNNNNKDSADEEAN